MNLSLVECFPLCTGFTQGHNCLVPNCTTFPLYVAIQKCIDRLKNIIAIMLYLGYTLIL